MSITTSDGQVWDDPVLAAKREEVLQIRLKIIDATEIISMLKVNLNTIKSDCNHKVQYDVVCTEDYREEYDYDNREGYAVKVFKYEHHCKICDYIWRTQKDV